VGTVPEQFESYRQAREKGQKIVLPHEEIPFCSVDSAESVYLGLESGWWHLCTNCQRWFPATSIWYMPAHTVDGYIVVGGCAIGNGLGLITSDRGHLTSEVNGPADAALLRYGVMAVRCIADAVCENRLAPIHLKTLQKALAYVKRVNLQGEDVKYIMQASKMLGGNE
jgi:hypothetical protein